MTNATKETLGLSEARVLRLQADASRLREEANMDDRASDTSKNPDAKPVFAEWARMKRQRAEDIEALIAARANPLSEGEREHRLSDEDILVTIQRIIDNVEEIDRWGDDGRLVTIHCHAGVLLEDVPFALAASPSRPLSEETVGLGEAITELRRIVAGIDSPDDRHTPDGWWETSTGAEFGSKKLAELEQFVARLILSALPVVGEVKA